MDMSTKQLLLTIGIVDHTNIDEPVIDAENADDGEFFIKFMSDFGHRDDEQGVAFKNWMDQNGIGFTECSNRSFIVNTDQFETAFGPLF